MAYLHNTVVMVSVVVEGYRVLVDGIDVVGTALVVVLVGPGVEVVKIPMHT